MQKTIDYYSAPVNCALQAGLERYVEHGVMPGGFMSAVLRNDMKNAFRYADDENAQNMANIMQWIECNLPIRCWGSASRVAVWTCGAAARQKRLAGE